MKVFINYSMLFCLVVHVSFMSAAQALVGPERNKITVLCKPADADEASGTGALTVFYQAAKHMSLLLMTKPLDDYKHIAQLHDHYCALSQEEKNHVDDGYTSLHVLLYYDILHILKQSLEHHLTSLDDAEVYWHWYVYHKLSFMLTQELFSSKQWDDIESTLERIALEKKYAYEQYGSVMRTLNYLKEFGDNEKMKAWIVYAERNIASLCYENSTIHDIFDVPKIINDVKLYCAQLPERIADLKKPSHVRRYWLAYFTSAIGIAALAWGYNANKDVVDSFVVDTLLGEYRQNLMDNLYDIFYAKLKYLFESLFKERIEIQEVPKRLGKIKISYDESLDLQARIKKSIEKIPLEIPLPITSYTLPLPKQNEVKNQMAELCNELIREYVSNKNKLVDAVLPLARGVVQDVENNRATLAVAAITPAVITLAGIYKSLSSLKSFLTQKDFTAMQLQLSDIMTLLIQNGDGSMHNEAYGKLMHLLCKLDLHAINRIPEEYRNHFTRDIHMLASLDFTSLKKKECITNMRNTYACLTPQVVS